MQAVVNRYEYYWLQMTNAMHPPGTDGCSQEPKAPSIRGPPKGKMALRDQRASQAGHHMGTVALKRASTWSAAQALGPDMGQEGPT